MKAGEPLLLICNGFPPVRGIGGRRWAKFAKELARRGHPVHVIRSAGRPGELNSLWAADGAAPGITHHPLPPRYPLVLTKRPLAGSWEKLLYRFWARVLPLLCKGNWYDSTILWRKQLLRKAGQLIGEHGIRQVVVTGAPFRLMTYGAELKQQFPQINLVVDFRDEWTWKGHYGLASVGAKRQRYEQVAEAMVVHQADVVTSPHASILEHLKTAHIGATTRYCHIPNIVDPDDSDLAELPAPTRGFRMIYAGSLYGAEEAAHYFEQLILSLLSLRGQDPNAFSACRLDLYITGHGTEAYVATVGRNQLSGHVFFHPPKAPKEVLQQIKQADLALLFIPSVNKDIMGTKFQAILYIGTPILHVGAPGLVSRTIEGRRMGASIRVEELVAELPKIISGERVVEVDRHADHSAYLLANVTDRLLKEVLV